jgi:L-ascorbate metabolism protein UlaG (beta-lactamase superfamily)
MSAAHRYRLHPSVIAEPLINHWYAWVDVLSPVPFSMHLKNYQLKLLESYCADPASHARATAEPSLTGGPFVGIPVARAGEVSALLARSTAELADNLALAQALVECFGTLTRDKKGESLEPSYAAVPEPLRGYVELVYDYFNHPIVRPLEALLYRSPYYKPQIQSLRLYRSTRDASRDFFLNTPRLPSDTAIDWRVPFASGQLDDWFDLETQARPLDYILGLLGAARPDPTLLGLLTEAERGAAERWREPRVRLRYFGHACVLLEWNGVSVLMDPWIGPPTPPGGPERLSFDDLPPRIDFALVTHGHHDHFVIETLLRLRRRIDCLVVPRASGVFYADGSLKMAAQRLGFRHVIEVQELETLSIGGLQVTAVPFFGEHADLPHAKTAYVVSAGGQRIFFGADSNCLERRIYEHIRREVGDIQTVFLGMESVGAPLTWMYGALLPIKPAREHSQSRRTQGCDRRAAREICEALGCQRVYVYAMGREPWLQHGMGMIEDEQRSPQIRESDALISELRERGGVAAQRLYARYETVLGG